MYHISIYYGNIFLFFDGGVGACAMGTMVQWSVHAWTTQKAKYWTYHGSAGVLQCYRRQSMLTELWKIRPSVTLYSFNRLLSNLARLITSKTPTHVRSFVKFCWVRNTPPPRFVKYNYSMTFCAFPTRLAAKPVGIRRRPAAQDVLNLPMMGVPFGGLDPKWVPLPISPQILANSHYENRF